MAIAKSTLITTFMDFSFFNLYCFNIDFLILDYKFRKRMIIMLLLLEKLPQKMINSFFIEKINENFPYNFTSDQIHALEKLTTFLFSNDGDHIFLLTGYAGTGKSRSEERRVGKECRSRRWSSEQRKKRQGSRRAVIRA